MSRRPRHGTLCGVSVTSHPVEPAAEQAGYAHVGTASFLASRVAPTGGFAIALAGGLAVARVAQRSGLRAGFGTSIAAMLQNVALMGPARLSIPLTQAVSAPLLGRQHARGAAAAVQMVTCAAIRLVDQLAMTAFYIWIVVGGLGPYADTFDATLGRLPLVPKGQAAALALGLGGLLFWTVSASIVQVLVYRRGLDTWPATVAPPPADVVASATAPSRPRPRFDPRAVALSAGVAFAVLLTGTDWILLAAVAAWLAVAWALSRADSEPVRAGLALAAMLGLGALVAGLVGGGGGLEATLQRTVRAVLLVLVATWLRAAAGEDGLREVARRSLRRLHRLPAAREAEAILERLGTSSGLTASGRALMDAVRDVPRSAGPLADAVLGWIAAETAHFAMPTRAPPGSLAVRGHDRLLVAGVLVATAALVLPLA